MAEHSPYSSKTAEHLLTDVIVLTVARRVAVQVDKSLWQGLPHQDYGYRDVATKGNSNYRDNSRTKNSNDKDETDLQLAPLRKFKSYDVYDVQVDLHQGISIASLLEVLKQIWE